jgi:hypothetical protein
MNISSALFINAAGMNISAWQKKTAIGFFQSIIEPIHPKGSCIPFSRGIMKKKSEYLNKDKNRNRIIYRQRAAALKPLTDIWTVSALFSTICFVTEQYTKAPLIKSACYGMEPKVRQFEGVIK